MSKSHSLRRHDPLQAKNRRCSCFTPEALESRQLLSAVPTDFEQYMLQVINRARANPAAEAARLGIDLNEGLAPGTISGAPSQPLAFNPDLVQAAQDYTAALLGAYNYFDHSLNGTTPQSRMEADGYVFTNPFTYTEDLTDVYEGYGHGHTPFTVNTATTDTQYKNLFIDSGASTRGDRQNILDPTFAEIGIGIMASTTYEGSDVPPDMSKNYAVMTTQDLAATGADPNPFLTGVAFSDEMHDQFYAPGEGIANATITATRASDSMAFTATTWSSGGYSLAVPAGTYTVVASGGTLAAPITLNNIVVGTQNVEADFVAPSGGGGGGGGTVAGNFTGSLPTAVVVGQKAKVSQNLVISNTGSAALSESVGVAYFLSTSGIVDSSAVALPGSVNKVLKLKANKSLTLHVKLAAIPAGIAPGSYYLIAQLTDPTGAKTDFATTSTLTVQPAQIDLTGAFVKAAATVKNGKPAVISISVTNNGNVPAVGALPIQLALSTVGPGDPAAIELPILMPTLHLQAGKTVKISLHAVIASVLDNSYFVLVSLDPANTFSDINTANNSFASATAVISVTG